MSKDFKNKADEPRHIFGCGTLSRIEDIIKGFSPARIMIVTDKNAYSKTGLQARMEKVLKSYESICFSEVSPNPDPESLLKGSQTVGNFKPDMIIALGGGSVMDTAKLISVLPADRERMLGIIRGEEEVPERQSSLILVPTTAGTGSECTHFAVVYDGNKKYSVASWTLLPDKSITDPELTAALPEKAAAVSAFDAFCQAVESYWAVGSTFESRQYSAQGIKLFNESFLSFVKKRDRHSCENMMRAAHLGGMAINITKTTAPHALSYALTMNYSIPHGYAVILTLPEFFVFNANAPESLLNEGVPFGEHKKRMKELCQLMESDSPDSAAARIRQAVESVGFAVKLSEAGIKNRDDIEKIASGVNLERLENNPVRITKKQIEEMLARIW